MSPRVIPLVDRSPARSSRRLVWLAQDGDGVPVEVGFAARCSSRRGGGASR
ncbi:hypothetical protein ACRAWF_02765 [Streptomyces sp. L7]